MVEVLVVALIVGLLAAAASVTLVARARSATLDDTVRRIAFLDALARRTARGGGRPATVTWDLDGGLITVAERDRAPGAGVWVQRLLVPSGQRIARVWVEDAGTDPATDRLSRSDGAVAVPCSAEGYTPTYAALIEGPHGEARRIVFLGLTGEPFPCVDDRPVDALFSALASGGTDPGAPPARTMGGPGGP